MRLRSIILGVIGALSLFGALPAVAAVPTTLTLQHKHFRPSQKAAHRSLVRRWARYLRHSLLLLRPASLFIFAIPLTAHATPSSLTLQHKHFLFSFSPADIRSWQRPQEQWMYRDHLTTPPAAFRVEGDDPPPLPAGWKRTSIVAWDPAAIALTVQRKVAAVFDRPAGAVTIGRMGSGSIVFDGIGMQGRAVDIPAAVRLILTALQRGVDHVTLPVIETQPAVTVTDPALAASGIRELVTIGESDYAGSPVNRRHNIAVGVARFNGTLIAQGEDFSFNKALGRVDATTGYRKELVIKGDRTEPDYGGGLCQISTTAYRGVWEYGFPILKRKNHSFTVRYYGPQGTDATVYPGSIDMIFKNDTPGALLVQTHIEDSKAYFLYYGTRDGRSADVVGPYTWDFREAPPPRTEFTTEIPPGDTKKIGEAVRGMKALWYRVVRKGDREIVEPVSSAYEARPLFHQIGVRPEEMPAVGSGSILLEETRAQ